MKYEKVKSIKTKNLLAVYMIRVSKERGYVEFGLRDADWLPGVTVGEAYFYTR
jgi:hypothetical protein